MRYIILLLLASCATITGPSRYHVAVQGSPEITAVYQSTEYTLPATIPIKPEQYPIIVFNQPCYQSKTLMLNSKIRVGATFFGNILWLLPGLVVDFATENAFKVVDSTITAPKLSKLPICEKQ